MDGINWRNTLLSWANKTEFIEKPLQSLDAIDINEFFEKFKAKMLAVREIDGDLKCFIKQYYSEFEPNLDESGNITALDYMYIYSLFVHFSCVKYPKKYFHRVCMKLNEKCQETVAKFLSILMQSEQFDRASLREAIHQASPAVPRLSFINLMSDLHTPKGKLSPPTPSGVMLDQKAREIKMLKAQLDAEKYERGFLEVQCKQYEEQMNKLTNERKQYQLEIERLKSDIASHDTENFSPNRNVKDELAKNRLQKQIDEKNEQIYDLKTELENLMHDRDTTKKKLVYTEKETRKYLVRIEDLELAMTDQQTGLQDRDAKIQDLESQVNELEFHLQHLRDSIPKEVLDSSTDLLEFSMNQSALDIFSGGRQSPAQEPESMSVVIDVQLKETEREIAELRKKLLEYNNKFSAQICELLNKEPANTELNFENIVTLEEHFDAMALSYKNISRQLFELNAIHSKAVDDKVAVESELSKLKIHCDNLQQQYTESLHKIERLETDLKDLGDKNQDLDNMYKVLEDDYFKKSQESEKFKHQGQAVSKQLSKLQQVIEDLQAKEASAQKEIEKLTIDMAERATYVHEIEQKLATVTDAKSTAEIKLTDALLQKATIITKYENELAELKNMLKTQNNELDNLKLTSELKADDYNKQIQEKEVAVMRLLKEKNDLNIEMQVFKTAVEEEKSKLLKCFEHEELRLNGALESLQQKFVAVTNEVDTITNSMKELQEKNATLEGQRTQIENLNKQLGDVEKELKETQQSNNNFEIENSCLKDQLNALEGKHTVLDKQLIEIQVKYDEKITQISVLETKLQEVSLRYEEQTAIAKGEVDNKQKQLVEQEIAVQQLNERLALLENDIKLTDDAKTKLFEENKDLKCQNESLSNVASSLSSAIERANRRIAELQQQVDSQKIELQKLSHEKNQDAKRLDTELKVAVDKAANLEMIIEKSRLEIKQLQNDTELIEAEKSALIESVTILQNECNVLDEQLKKVVAETEELEGRIEVLVQQISTGKEKSIKEKDDLEACIANLNDEKKSLIESLDKVIAERNVVAEEMDAINASNCKLVQKLETTTAQKTTLVKSLNRIQSIVHNLKHDNSKLKADVQQQVSEFNFDSITAEMNLMKNQIDQQLKANQELIEMNKKLKQEKDNEIKHYKNLVEKYHQLQQQVEAKDQDIKSLNNQIDEMQAVILKHEGECNLLQTQVASARLEVEKLKINKHELAQTLMVEQQESAKCRSEVTNVQRQLQSTLNEVATMVPELHSYKEQCALKEIEIAGYKRQIEMLTQDKNAFEMEANDFKKQLSIVKTDLEAAIECKTNENAALEVIADHLKAENGKLLNELDDHSEKLNEVQNALESTKTENSSLHKKVDDLQFEAQKTKEQLEDLHNNITNLTNQNTALSQANEAIARQVTELQHKYDAAKEVSNNKFEIERLQKQFAESDEQKAKENQKIIDLLKQLDQYKAVEKDVNELRENYNIEKAKNEKLTQDIKVLVAKLHKERDQVVTKDRDHNEQLKKLTNEIARLERMSDEKSRAVRSEMEAKLETMKERMKNLYLQDVQKEREKCEQEKYEFKKQANDQLNKVISQNEDLKKQLRALNDVRLTMVKENQSLKNELQLSGSTRSLASRQSMLPPPPIVNFRMEDEEGEVFDNTYLLDLKQGNMPADFAGRDSLRLSDVQRRNSLWLPHMRSSYMPFQLDHNDAAEDEIKNGGQHFDDSGSSLLGNQASGAQRKKLGGKLAYHKPGPPTPSKNAGRLSFGNDDIPNSGKNVGSKENRGGPTKKPPKSPAIKLFTGKIKDENAVASPRRRLSNFFNRKKH